jgi:hypothetical protein
MSRKNNKTAMTENEQAAELEPDALDKSTVTSLQFLMPSITVLGDILIETNDNYQVLVGKSQTLPAAKEAGKTLRYLSKQYAKVLIAALDYPYDDIEADEDDELEFEDEDKDEEEQI